MDRTLSRTILIAAAMISTSILFEACNSGSASTPASSGTTTSSAPIYAVIGAPNAPAITRTAINSYRTEAEGSVGAQPQATTTTCAGIGTLSGRDGNVLHGYSCTGYVFDISGCSSNSCTGVIQTLPAGAGVMFDAAGCTGNMYVATDYTTTFGGQTIVEGIPDALVPNGVVFRYQATGFTPTDASTYFYVPAGETKTAAAIQSVYQFNGAGGGTCSPLSIASGTATLYAVQQAPALDPTTNSSTTDVPVAPVTGPVVVTHN